MSQVACPIWYSEWSQQPNTRKGRMIESYKIPKLIENLKDPGYSSVYQFREEDAKKVIESGCSKGLNKFIVGADRLMIDIDKDNIEDAKTIVEKYKTILKLHGINYRIWFSGSKGFHIELPHRWMESEHLPYSHLKAVEALGIEEFDRSLYQHGRLLSLPGRIHPKTGKKKSLVEYNEGVQLTLAIVEKPEPKFDYIDTEKDLKSVLATMSWLCEASPKCGSRHQILWSTAKDCREAGLDRETVHALLQEINSKWPEPKSQDEVFRAVKQAYGIS